MKNLILTISMSIILLGGLYAQQNVVFPMSKTETQSEQLSSKTDEAIIPDDLKDKKFYEEYIFPIPVILYGDDYNALKLEAKEKVVEAVFGDYCRSYSNLICALLSYHAGPLVKVPVEDHIAPTKRKEKNKGAYKFYAEKAKVNKALINYIAAKSDIFFRENTVVLYHPVVGSKNDETIVLFENTRRRLQSAFADYKYKILSLKNIGVMPVCKFDSTEINLNFYRELMLCVNDAKRVNASVLVVVRGIDIKSVEKKENNYNATVEMAIDIFNSHTYSFILSKFYMASAEFSTKMGAVEEAIKKIITEQIDDMMYQQTATYYNYIMNGKEISIELSSSSYKNDNDLKEFEDSINSSKIFKITNINKSTDKTVEYKCLSYEPLQFNVVNLLRELKPKSIIGKVEPEGDVIIIK